MHLSELSLINFKNHATWEGSFNARINGITGLNGVGKTNILDAIYMLAFCKSNFQTTDKVLCMAQANYYSIKGIYIDHEIDFSVECLYKEGSRKQVKYNGNAYPKLSNHIGVIPLVMVTPQDIFLIIEGSDERRRLIDMTISQLDREYLERLNEYFKILEHRNKLLRHLNENPRADQTQLEIWNHQLVEKGIYIFECRMKYLLLIAPIIERIYNHLSGESELVTANYISTLHEGDFSSQLSESLPKDLVLERTTIGIHKDDWEFLMNGIPIKKFGSQGQQKTFVFALKLALHEFLVNQTGKAPILLLDDLFEKLDLSRSANLLEYVATQITSQVFISDTDANRIKDIVPNAALYKL